MLKRFNLRVYGLLLHRGRLLLVDEQVRGREITKFPGGGLELGEGPIECLVREFHEETGIDVRVREHVYTTGFFQQSAFSPEDQIISIYYRVEPASRLTDEHFEIPFERHRPHEQILRFHWLPLEEVGPGEVTLPIDRYVVEHCLPGLGRDNPGAD